MLITVMVMRAGPADELLDVVAAGAGLPPRQQQHRVRLGKHLPGHGEGGAAGLDMRGCVGLIVSGRCDGRVCRTGVVGSMGHHRPTAKSGFEMCYSRRSGLV